MKLSWQKQDRILVKRFRLTDEELEAGRQFRAFARTALGIDVHVGQVAFAACVLLRHPVTPYTAKYLTLLLSSGNRAGKTALLAMLIIYCCLRKLNRPIPANEDEAGRWLKMEYHWYHFGISQEVADLVYNDMVRILGGTHEGQEGRGCPMAEGREVADWTLKEYGDYRWVRFSPEVGGAQVHFRTTGEKALGTLGKDMHGLSFDEAGIERNLDFLIKEVFGMRRLGTGGQLIMVSTPSEDLGFQFADNWAFGDPASKDRKESWQSMRMSTRDNIGYGISKDMFDRLTADMDERTILQNIEGFFLQARAAYFNGENVEKVFVHGMPERLPAVKDGIYLQGIDPAKTQDSAWSIVLKVVDNEADPTRPYVVGVYAEEAAGQKSTERIVGLAVNGFNGYERERLKSHCYTATDATGFGGKLFREALDVEVPNVTNVEFGGTVQRKRKLLGDLRTLIDEGRLILPRTGIWLKVRRQLLGYKLEDRGIEQDAVMALVCAIHLLRIAHTTDATASPFDMDGTHSFPLEQTTKTMAQQLAHERMKARSLRG
ncbi:MAG: hypothetical protein H0W36_00660 [Gemmatimonadetes bacterium]|nr:hypothetical protein [Gemmatimonadota bacterium]